MAATDIDMLMHQYPGHLERLQAPTFMVGGTSKAFAIAEPLFTVMGNKAVYVGQLVPGKRATRVGMIQASL